MSEPLGEGLIRIAPDMAPLDDSLGRLSVLFRDVADAIDRYRDVVDDKPRIEAVK